MHPILVVKSNVNVLNHCNLSLGFEPTQTIELDSVDNLDGM